MTYTATSGKLSAIGDTETAARKNLTEIIRRKCESYQYVDLYGRPLRSQREIDAARRREAKKMIDRITVSITVSDLSGWDDDQFFAGNGHSRLATTEWREWTIESDTDAVGKTTYTACRSAEMTAAARRSFAAGGGVRGLCMEHVTPAERIILSAGDNLITVLGGKK